MDQYILFIFMYIATVLAELAVIQWFTLSEKTEEHILYADAGILAGTHVGLAAYMRFHVLPSEQKAKFDDADLSTMATVAL